MKPFKVSINSKELKELCDWYEFNPDTQSNLECVVSKLEFSNLHEMAVGLCYIHRLLKVGIDVFEFPLSFLLTKGDIDGE